MKIGFIGLGNMGSAMAINLLKAGHDLTVYNRTADKTTPLLKQGARAAANPGEASCGDVVFTMLADDHAVESVIIDDSGILANLRSGSVHISSSTISVALAQKLTAAHERQNQRFILLLFSDARRPPRPANCSLSSPAVTTPSSAARPSLTLSGSALFALESSLRPPI